jgi:hypothetical protein
MTKKFLELISELEKDNCRYSKNELENGLEQLRKYTQTEYPVTFNHFQKEIGYISLENTILSSAGLLKINKDFRLLLNERIDTTFPKYIVLLTFDGGEIEYFINLSIRTKEGESPVIGLFPGLPYTDPRNTELRNKDKYPDLNFDTFEEFFYWVCDEGE